jgi:plastocyanin
MFRYIRIVPLIAALVVAAGGVIACSSNDDNKSSSTQPTAVASQPGQGGSDATTNPAATRVTIVDFSYAPAAITAKAGQPVTLEVTNSGQSAHTFTITGVVDSGSIGAGQSKAVTFTPSSAGSLQFFCTIHGASVMSGKLTVE